MRTPALEAALADINAAYDRLATVLATDYPLGSPISWRRGGATHQGHAMGHADRVLIQVGKTEHLGGGRPVYITVYDLV